MIDAQRVAFVQSAFRYTEAKDDAVAGRNPDAQIVRLDTNLTYDAAVLRAQDELAAGKNVRVFDVEVEALLFFDDFKDGPPAFEFTSEREKVFARKMRVVGFTADTNSGTSVLRLRG